MKVWFITGTAGGFGRAWTTGALERGDAVVATSLELESAEELVAQYGDRVLPIQVDVRDRDAVEAAVQAGVERFGRLDVVINNAGYGHLGMVEEFTEAEARAQFETNFFGSLFAIQAVLPVLRSQASGHILQVSSIGGVVAYPFYGVYNASKWAVEGMTQALAGEVAPFGIHVTLIEPSGFATDWWGPHLVKTNPLEPYVEARKQLEATWALAAPSRALPETTVDAILACVDSAEPPLRLLLGDGAFERVEQEYLSRLDVWRAAQS